LIVDRESDENFL
jgi:hypothetical protein